MIKVLTMVKKGMGRVPMRKEQRRTDWHSWYSTPAVLFSRGKNMETVHRVYTLAVLPSGGIYSHISRIRGYRKPAGGKQEMAIVLRNYQKKTSTPTKLWKM